MNYRHLFDPLVIEKMWLLLKHVKKIHALLFITNFHVRIIVSFKPRTGPTSMTWRLSTSTAHIATNFIIHCVLLFATPLYMYNVYI